MNKATVIIMALLIATAFTIGPAHAQDDIVVEASDADYSFGQHITFNLQARSSIAITEVNLRFRVQGQTDTTVVSVPFEAGSQVSVHYPLGLTGQNIPPFAFITYWWEVHDANGARARSGDNLLYYADNRYDWKFVQDQRDGIRWGVYWVNGDVVFGQTALNVAIKAIDEINRELKAPVLSDIRIYIYPNEQDLRSALNLTGYEWAGGQARPELGAILVGIPNDLYAPGEMDRLIPHELTHLLVYEATGRVRGQTPPWLNEGLASLSQVRPDPDRQTLLEEALDQNRLIPLQALCAPFPADPNAARLAYAQSASVVHYIRETYGSQVIRDLLTAYTDNISCDAGVTRVLGKNLQGLDLAWRADMSRQGQPFLALQDSAVWLGLWALTVLLALPLLGVLRRGNPLSSVAHHSSTDGQGGTG